MVEWWRPEYFFQLDGFEHRALFDGVERVWEALARLREYVDARLEPSLGGTVMPGAFVSDEVWLGDGAVVEPGAMIKGPAIIGPGSVIRQGAYVREYVVVGAGCVVGHATEVKGSILLDGAQAPHFNYVGDSILGRRANLGAGTKLSNLKNDGTEVVVHGPGGERIRTGMCKLGAVVGDGVAIGCNAVTSPGALIGPRAQVYANVVVRGFVPADHVVKLRQAIEAVPLERPHGPR
ncbi:hypothetical protein U7230_02360 [Carboxydochorda subterranea]|uniref:Mannose-1-phosphate guanyltransferase C-terminal domain-containing protein n=1 Tax=Carboxydichorda subterranea TaxID=3109565 RepID=A0ABZ1BYI3_9FIRM|nr:hypothetical protein [Limnochorda sp. L945t]WRP17875.1 hypothetical protein U7230_02360 [Limnochorda sp. L945t]